MKYGYARVSSVGQDLTIQVQTLKNAGCDVVREEKVSGTSLNGRTELQTLMEFMRDGDELVVTRIDRLARSIRDLQNLVHELKQRGVTLSLQLSNPSIPRQVQGKRFWTCWASSLSSKPIFGKSGRWKVSERQKNWVSTKDAAGLSMHLKSSN